MQRAPLVNPDSLPPGAMVGLWRVLGLGSQGSFGIVYRVEQDGLSGTFALKLALQPGDPRFALDVASPADDVYVLGVTAYRLAAGRYPLLAEELGTDSAQEELFFRFPELAEEQPEPVAAPVTVRPWRVALTVAAACLLLVAGGLLHALVAPSSPASAGPHAQAAQASAWNGDTAGVGEVALTKAENASEPKASRERLSAPVPAEPLPGQRLPPCKKPQVEINRGCWIQVANQSSPCIETTYEWRKQCYMPFFGPPRPSTAGEK